jgi:hypothetical protein
MSLVVGCDTGSLGLDDIFRLISGIDVDGNTYIRVCDDETDYDDLSNLDCEDFGVSALDILRGALFLNDDGEYCLNVSTATAVLPFCATYQDVYDSFTTPPSDAIALEQNTMVCGLVDDGVWAKLDLFYVFAQTTNGGGEALVNWVNPGTFDATAFNAPAFVALEGFTGDGASTYIDCNVALSALGNYSLDSASLGTYIRTNVDEVKIDAGVKTGGNYSYLVSRLTGLIYHRINQAAIAGGVANADSRGMYINNRTASNAINIFKNKIEVFNGATVSTAVPTDNLYALALNDGGTESFHITRQLSLLFAGSEFTQTDVDNMYDRFQAYMTSNGKEV